MILLSNWITGLWSGLELSLFDWYHEESRSIQRCQISLFIALTSLTDCESCQKLVQQFLPSVNSLFMQVMVAVLP